MKGLKKLKTRILSAFLAATMIVTGIAFPSSAVEVQAEESESEVPISVVEVQEEESNKIELSDANVSIKSGINVEGQGQKKKVCITDGDKGTFWESWESNDQANNPIKSMPQEIIFTLDGFYDLDKIVVMRDNLGNPVNDSYATNSTIGEGNGRLQRYRVSVSADNENWYPDYSNIENEFLTTGNFPIKGTQNWYADLKQVRDIPGTVTFNNTQTEYEYESTFLFSELKELETEEVVDTSNVKYVKLELLESATYSSKNYDYYVRLAEVELYGEKNYQKADLEELINRKEQLKIGTYYTTESWKNLQNKLAYAQELCETENAIQSDMNTAGRELKAAYDALERLTVNFDITANTEWTIEILVLC